MSDRNGVRGVSITDRSGANDHDDYGPVRRTRTARTAQTFHRESARNVTVRKSKRSHLRKATVTTPTVIMSPIRESDDETDPGRNDHSPLRYRAKTPPPNNKQHPSLKESVNAYGEGDREYRRTKLWVKGVDGGNAVGNVSQKVKMFEQHERNRNRKKSKSPVRRNVLEDNTERVVNGTRISRKQCQSSRKRNKNTTNSSHESESRLQMATTNRHLGNSDDENDSGISTENEDEEDAPTVITPSVPILPPPRADRHEGKGAATAKSDAYKQSRSKGTGEAHKMSSARTDCNKQSRSKGTGEAHKMSDTSKETWTGIRRKQKQDAKRDNPTETELHRSPKRKQNGNGRNNPEKGAQSTLSRKTTERSTRARLGYAFLGVVSVVAVGVTVPVKVQQARKSRAATIPTISPIPTSEPSISLYPSHTPTLSKQPSFAPSSMPTLSQQPSLYPSVSHAPSLSPSASPSISAAPSTSPSDSPSYSSMPSWTPSLSSFPSANPSVSFVPSDFPGSGAETSRSHHFCNVSLLIALFLMVFAIP